MNFSLMRNQRTQVNTHLADHGGFSPESSSLDTLVGTFPPISDEKLLPMNGFSWFGKTPGKTVAKIE